MQLLLHSTSQLETNGLSVLLPSLFAGEESVDDGILSGFDFAAKKQQQ